MHMLKLFNYSGLALLLVCTWLTARAATPVIIPSPPQLSAKAYMLVDAVTGKVLVEHNADEQLPPASLTKMMTSYIVTEEILQGNVKESDLVIISDDAWRRGGSASGSSTMFLEPRTKVPVIDLLRGVIIQSGNDASIALAEHLAGSEDAFADVMNQYAALLGMQSTQFKNATGWPAEGHMTTTRDLVTLAKAVIYDHPEHYPLHAERYFQYNGFNQANRNRLLFKNPAVDGLKTGHTKAAGYCLVASAKKQGMRLISVVMGTKSVDTRAIESEKLLSYGFRYFKTHKVYSQNEVVKQARVWKGKSKQVDIGLPEEVVITIPRGAEAKLDAQMSIDTTITAPIKKNQVLGELNINLENESIYRTDLVAIAVVEPSGFFARLWDSVRLFFSGLFA